MKFIDERYGVEIDANAATQRMLEMVEKVEEKRNRTILTLPQSPPPTQQPNPTPIQVFGPKKMSATVPPSNRVTHPFYRNTLQYAKPPSRGRTKAPLKNRWRRN